MPPFHRILRKRYSFCVILLTNKNKRRWKHNLLGGSNVTSYNFSTTAEFFYLIDSFHQLLRIYVSFSVFTLQYNDGPRQNAERDGSVGRIWMMTICGSIGLEPICGSVITVGLRLGLELGLGLVLGLALGLGLLIVVYKLLEKVTKCGSITWSKPTNGDPPRSAFCRACPCKITSPILERMLLMINTRIQL